jgi:chromosome segregation ATPase
LIVAGWFVAGQQQTLAENQKTLFSANHRLEQLEERLHLTDETMSQSGDEVQSEMGLWKDEIRKLWDVSNKRNRTWIQDNQATLKKQAATLSGVQAELRDIRSAVSNHDKAFDQQTQMLDKLTAIEIQLQSMVARQRSLVDGVNGLKQTAANLQTRVQSNEQAIEAIDAYRVQMNRRLVDISKRLDTIAGSPLP